MAYITSDEPARVGDIFDKDGILYVAAESIIGLEADACLGCSFHGRRELCGNAPTCGGHDVRFLELPDNPVLPKKLSNTAYKKAKEMRYENFVQWWDTQHIKK